MAAPEKTAAPPKPSKMARVRNIGIVAHIDAGKTTVTERFLFHSGRIHKIGEVHEGEATMDRMPQERERGITITAAATSFAWRNHDIHLIDTPGHVDFTSRSSDCCACWTARSWCSTASSGVEPQSETVWRQADKFRVPRIAFINKMDRAGADFAAAVTEIANGWAQAGSVQLPIGVEDKFAGVVDLIRQRALFFSGDETEAPRKTTCPAAMADEVAAAREKLIEAAADVDDAIASAFLEGQPLDETQVKAALRKARSTARSCRCSRARRAQQGRAAAARRCVRLPAVAAGGAARDRPCLASRSRPAARPTTRRPSARWLQGRDAGGAQGDLPAHLLGRAAPGRRGPQRADAAQ